MAVPADFELSAKHDIVRLLGQRGVMTFRQAAAYIRDLPYRRNSRKDDLCCVIDESCGTCSTKHALLRKLAELHHHPEIKLYVGIYRMNAVNTPRTGKILEAAGLSFLPEAHNYIRIGPELLDVTWGGATGDFEADLLTERETAPGQIGEWKVQYHREFLDAWRGSSGCSYSLEELWKVREDCIAALSRAS